MILFACTTRSNEEAAECVVMLRASSAEDAAIKFVQQYCNPEKTDERRVSIREVKEHPFRFTVKRGEAPWTATEEKS